MEIKPILKKTINNLMGPPPTAMNQGSLVIHFKRLLFIAVVDVVYCQIQYALQGYVLDNVFTAFQMTITLTFIIIIIAALV